MTGFDGTTFRISVTAERAKTRNLTRDPRATLHVLGQDFWSYASVSCTAGLGEVSTQPGDRAGQDLLSVFNSISDTPHPDPDEFLAVMVKEHRLVLSQHADSITGMGW